MLRLFVAIDLPEAAKTRLSLLASGLPGARWVEPKNHHVTLAFAGEVDEAVAGHLDQELAEIKGAPFPLEIAGVGSFESKGKLKSLWADVKLSEPLSILQGRVAGACARAGIVLESRKFKPHVSLARFKDQPSKGKLGDWLMQNGLLRLEPLNVREFVLFQSHLGGSGPHYEALVRYPL
ncbi:MAG: RNA 2',3'-cyclic phosphodiesterase [Rhodospirillales bacterium]|nr:MAG: RNA 2',3'-cyclic phosphodiesterase [Rhodospirillales bacterium]